MENFQKLLSDAITKAMISIGIEECKKLSWFNERKEITND